MGLAKLVDSTILFEQFIELQSKYPRLRLTQDEKGLFVIRGELDFAASFEDVCIEDSYSIEIILPNDFPNTPPRIIESNNRIPSGYHMFTDGTLCLGTPVAVKKTFFQTPTLIGFVENNVIPYFYGYSYKCKYGSLPLGSFMGHQVYASFIKSISMFMIPKNFWVCLKFWLRIITEDTIIALAYLGKK